MLVTKTVKIFGTPKNVSHYSKLGYDIKYHEYMDVLSVDLPHSSKIKVDVMCDYCGEIIQKCWCNYVRGHNNINKDSCKKCSSLKNLESVQKVRLENPDFQKSVTEKRENTMLQKYGHKNPSQIEQFVKKRKATNVSIYGCANPYQNAEIQAKMRETMIARYGVPYSLQNDNIRRKAILTCYSHYGVYYPMQSKEVIRKMTKNSLQKYGTEYPIMSSSVQSIIRRHFLDKYGVEYPLQNYEILNKTFDQIRKNGYNFVLISNTQKFLSEVYDCPMNVKIHGYYVDLLFDEYNIVCEYDGGGHDLSVKLGQISIQDFELKERYRENAIIQSGYKIIRILNSKDKSIDKQTAIHIKQCGIKFLQNTTYDVYIYDTDTNNEIYR